MDDVTKALVATAPLCPFLNQWTLEAMDDWHREHPVSTRLRMSTVTRDDYIYDQIVGRAETASLPVPIRVPKYGRMRLITFVADDIEVALWPKKVHHVTHLTSNYPTDTAVKRQHKWTLFGLQKLVLFVFGHTILETLAGAEAWIDRILLTQETRADDGTRSITLRRSLYHSNIGSIPLQISDPNLPLFGTGTDGIVVPPTDQHLLPPPIIKPRVDRREGDKNTPPKVGIPEAKRVADEAARREQSKRKSQDGSKGA